MATKQELAAALAAAHAQLAAVGGTVTNGIPVPTTVPVTAAPSQAETDRALLDKIVAKFGKDNGFGPSTGNVHWSLPKSARPEGVTGPFVITVGSASGPVQVPATVMTLTGAMLGVNDFVQVPSASGDTKVWTSAAAVKRINATGYTLTKRSKIWLSNGNGTSSARSAAVRQVVDAASLL